MSNYLKRPTTNKKYALFFVLSLLPMFFYSIYKYSITPWLQGFNNYLELLKVPSLLLINIIIVFLYNFHNHRPNYYLYYETSVLVLLLPITVSYYLSVILCLLYLLFNRLLVGKKINCLALSLLIGYFGLFFLKKLNYSAIYESSIPNVFTTIDMFFGHSIAPIGAASPFLIIITYFLLSLNNLYKKDIPWHLFIFYLFLVFSIGIYSGNAINIIKNTLNSNILLSFVCLIPLNYASPITKKGELWYCFFISVLTFFLLPIVPYFASLIASILCSLVYSLISFIKKAR